MSQKRKAVQFGPPGKLWFAPTAAPAQNVQPAAANQFPRLQKPEPVSGDEATQVVPQPFQVKEH